MKVCDCESCIEKRNLRISDNTYITIYYGEDGDICTSVCSKEELLFKIREDYWGANAIFCSSFEDINYGVRNQYHDHPIVIIIKGKIVIPTAKTVVTEWEIV